MSELPEHRAKVMWWNSSSMYIRCPHCDHVHHHGFDGQYHARQSRAPHCGEPESYEACFPLGGQYEIDKNRMLYVRAGADPNEYFAQFDPVPEVDVSDRRKWTEAKEEIELDEYHRSKLQRLHRAFGLEPIEKVEHGDRLQCIVSDMINGRVQAVRAYLETSSEKEIFLHGVDAVETHRHDIDEWDAYQDLLRSGQAVDREPPEMKIAETETSGVSALHMAACEMHPDMVKLLLEYGADGNVRTVEGRTPLMEAAIWGRLKNVEYLLCNGADKFVRCIRKGKRLQAIDFARDTLENSEERYIRSGRKDQVYKEVTHERNKERAAIVRRLSVEGADDDQVGQIPISLLGGFALTSILGGKSTVSMLAHFDVPRQHKTIGVLFRSHAITRSAFPPVAAMSGWGHQPGSELNVQIAGRRWTDEVFQLCQTAGHELPADDRDGGEPGQFHACHAEKQLVAYFVSRHVILPHEVDRENEDLGMSGLSLGASRNDSRNHETLTDLLSIRPPQRLDEAVILVSRAVCGDCRYFVGKVNTALGLKIKVRGANLYD